VKPLVLIAGATGYVGLNKIVQIGNGFERAIDFVHRGRGELTSQRKALALAQSFFQLTDSIDCDNWLIHTQLQAAGEDAMAWHRVRGGKFLLGPERVFTDSAERTM
jgi:hypothetical protein